MHFSACNFIFRIIAPIILACSPTLRADLVVNEDLGTLKEGTVSLNHNTRLGANNSDEYSRFGSHVYGNEIVFRFTIENRLLLDLTSVSLTGDHDFFLLNSLSTEVNNDGLRFATGTVGEVVLDDLPPETESFGFLEPGIYYLSADSYDETAADFSINLSLSRPVPLDQQSAIPLGSIAAKNAPFSIDTVGSVFDTELGVWNKDGVLIASNDDLDADSLQSRIDFSGLEAGTYYIGLGPYNTEYYSDFIAIAQDDDESGGYQLNYPNGNINGNLEANELLFFSFEVDGTTPFPDQELSISNISRNSDGSINIIFNSAPEKSYAVDISDDLVNWLELDDSINSTGSRTSFIHSTPDLASPTLFYRVREP